MSMHLCGALGAVVAVSAGAGAADRGGFPVNFAVAGFPPSAWSAEDVSIGLDADHVIERFEDVDLIPGLRIAVITTSSGSYGPTGTLPATFDPVADDGFGDAFNSGVWDGTRVLVNTGTNQSRPYATQGNWGDVQLLFSTPAARVGFSVQQMDIGGTVSVNGFPLGNLLALAGLTAGSGRNGYVVIEAQNPSSSPITFIEINNGAGDGFVIDHLAVRFVFCPGDTDGDGFVLFNDLNEVVSAFNTASGDPGYRASADFDENGMVDFEDLNEVLSRFNDPCTGE